MNSKFQKMLSLILTLAMLCSLICTTAFAAEPDGEASDSAAITETMEAGENTEDAALAEDATEITGGAVITAGGKYTVTDTTPGVITIQTTGVVTLSGGSSSAFLNGISFTNAWTDASGNQQTETVDVALEGLYIASPYNSGAVFDFAEGTTINFNYTGTNVLESQGYNNGAVIRVAKTGDSGGSKLTLAGNGTESSLYLYKHSGSAAIGGNMNEAAGEITINNGNLFVKGSQTGAIIGGDSKTVTNGDITINDGIICVESNARGAAIGASNQGECAGNVYINGGSTLINVDFSGSAIGRGASGTTTGTLYISGGSLKCVIDGNAGQYWKTSTTEATVSNNAITATMVYGNSGSRTADVAEVNLSSLNLSNVITVTATVNGAETTLYNRQGINRYDYQGGTITKNNWTINEANQSVYLYLPTDSTSGTILAEDENQNSKQFSYTYTGGKFVVEPVNTHTVTLAGDNVAYWVNGSTAHSVQVQSGASLTFYVKPNPGYQVTGVTATGSTMESHRGGYYTLPSVTANTTVTATAVEGKAYTVNFSAGNYTAYIGDTPVQEATLNSGGSMIFTPRPDPGYKITDVTSEQAFCDQETGGAWKIYNPQGEQDVTVNVITAETGQVFVDFTGSHAEALVDGAISTRVEAPYGGDLSFTVLPHLGYQVINVSAGSTTITPVEGVYTVENVTQDVTVTLTTTYDTNYWLNYADTSWYNSSETAFTLTDAADLAGLAKLVNDGTDNFQNKTVKLGNNIDLSGHAWAPIGGGGAMSNGMPVSGTPAFQGTFDGQGYTISGLSINPGAYGDGFGGFGLFGVVQGGTISNVTVEGAISFTNDVSAVGGIVGYTTGNISGVVNKVNVTVNNPDVSNTGGVAGVIENTGNEAGISITNSANLANVTGRARLGGIVGAMYSAEEFPVTVDGCYNTGTLTGVDSRGRAYVGGIAGFSEGAIKNCYNQGDITVGDGRYFAGGIAGLLNGASAPFASITDCYASGTLTSTGEPGLATLYAIWGNNDESAEVKITNVLYLSSQTQETMSATCTNLNAMESMATAQAIGSEYLDGSYFAQHGTAEPVLQWQVISVDTGTAAALNSALAQVDDVKTAVVLNTAVTLNSGDTVTLDLDDAYVARGDATNALITLNGGSLTVNSGRLFGGESERVLSLNSGTLTFAPATGKTFEIQGVVYLASGQKILVNATLANITGVINVTSEVTDPGTVIATCNPPTITTICATKFLVNGNRAIGVAPNIVIPTAEELALLLNS